MGRLRRFRTARLTVIAGLLAGSAIAWPGCGSGGSADGPTGPPYPGVGLRLAVLGDRAMVDVLDDRRGEWERSRGGTIAIEHLEGAASDAPPAADVIVFPADRLGALIDVDGLRTLPDDLVEAPVRRGSSMGDREAAPPPRSAERDELIFDEIAEPYREQVIVYGGRRVALPMGGAALVLVYRAAPFEDEALKNEAEAAGVVLEEPETWEQLDAVARFLHGRDLDGDGRLEAGIALALRADPSDRVGVETLIARAAAAGLHRDYYSLLFDTDDMAPRIDAPPFIAALEGLIGLRDAGPDGMAEFDAEGARAAFRAGEATLLIDRADRSSMWLEREDEAEVGVARLPGSARTFEPIRGEFDAVDPPNRPGYLPGGGGWLVGVSASSDAPEAASDLARYLVEPETASRLRADGRVPMLPVRSSLIAMGPPGSMTAPGVSRRDWSDAVARTLLADRVVVGLRIPGAADYLADLDAARASAASGEIGAEAALRSAADAWRARSEALGVDRQRWHYRSSLNSLVTDPTPPPR